jgi:LysM repeat protein
MPRKDSPQDVINAYQRRQRWTPFIFGSLAVLLVVIGIVFLVVWFSSSGNVKLPEISLFPSETPTPTNTVTNTPITPTITPTITHTMTVIPSVTVTPTPSGPFEYVVEEGDTCWDLADKFNVDFAVLLAMNNFGDQCPIQPGKIILIPAPGQALPTNTPLPIDDLRGAIVEYSVQMNDSLAKIAEDHNSTVEDIMERNEIEDANLLYVGQALKIKIGLVTPVPTLAPTSTTAPTAAGS